MITPITKLHEGCDVRLFKPSGNSGRGHITLGRIDKVYEDVSMFEYRNIWTDGGTSSFPSAERIQDWQILDFVGRDNKPLSIWTEFKVAVIAIIHGCLTRWGFDFK